MLGQPHKFVLQTVHPQYLYQVMEFKDMEQYKAFCSADKGTGMIHSQVGSRMMALRLSACLMELELRQDNVKETKGTDKCENIVPFQREPFTP